MSPITASHKLERAMKNEPLVTVATVTGAVAALLGLLVAFGVPLSGDQREAILAVVAVAAPFVVAFIVRPRVTPTSKVSRPETGAGELRMVGIIVAALLVAWLLITLLSRL